MMTRRFLLAAGAVSAAAATSPPALASFPPAALPAIPKPVPMPAWVVGHAGEMNAIVARAPTAEAAILQWYGEHGLPDSCECADMGIDKSDPNDRRHYCEYCQHSGVEAWRAEAMDENPAPTPGDWLRAGFGHTCSRCGYETDGWNTGHGIGAEAVCEDCLSDEERAEIFKEPTS